MGSLISDEDFAMLLVSSLPESWDLYTSAYLGSKADRTTLTSHELIAILLEEDCRRHERNVDPQDVAMQGQFTNKGEGRKKLSNSKKECFNCHKKGRMARDCWLKGRGKEGQGPKSQKKGKFGGGRTERTKLQTRSIARYLM
jgi:hypothetical protein